MSSLDDDLAQMDRADELGAARGLARVTATDLTLFREIGVAIEYIEGYPFAPAWLPAVAKATDAVTDRRRSLFLARCVNNAALRSTAIAAYALGGERALLALVDAPTPLAAKKLAARARREGP